MSSQKKKPVDYWNTPEGILLRLTMFSGVIEIGAYNNAFQVAAPIYNVQYLKMVGLDPVCDYCKAYYGRVYRLGMFLPEFPAHPNCTHTWDVWFPWEETSFWGLLQ